MLLLRRQYGRHAKCVPIYRESRPSVCAVVGEAQHGCFALMINKMCTLAAQHVKMYLAVSSAAKTDKSFQFM